MGQKQKYPGPGRTSVLHSAADGAGKSERWQERTHASQQSVELFDHPVSACEQRLRQCETERLCRFEVEN